MNKVIALVPMKGHSERVPNKNLRLFNGSPLYHRIVTCLLECPLVSKVAINTDSEKIKEDASKHFPSVVLIDRPKNICGDFVPMNDIIAYDMSKLNGEHFVQTHSTNPLLKPQTLTMAIEKYFKNLNQYDSVFSVTRHQARFFDKDGKAINHNPKELLRTQDLPPLFEENSNFYIFSKNSFEKSGHKRIGINPMMFEITKIEAVDIDEEIDFKMAEMIGKGL